MTQFCIEDAVLERLHLQERLADRGTVAVAEEGGFGDEDDPALAEAMARAREFAAGH